MKNKPTKFAARIYFWPGKRNVCRVSILFSVIAVGMLGLYFMAPIMAYYQALLLVFVFKLFSSLAQPCCFYAAAIKKCRRVEVLFILLALIGV